jgi:hypothetical protein
MTTSEDAATPRKSPSPATSTRSQCVCVATPSPTVQIATSRRTRHPRTLAATALTVAAISWSTAPRSGALAFAVTPDRERVSLASSLQPENDNNNNINHQPATVETKFNKKRRRTKHVVALDATLPPTPYAPPKTSRVTPNKHPSPETSNSRKRRLTGVAATGVPRTSSFPPLTADQFPYWQKEFSRKGLQPVLPHTLILGTHPSVTSLQQEQYYGHAVKYVVSYHFLSVAHITFLIQPEPTLSRMDRTISSFLSHSFLYFYLLAGFFRGIDKTFFCPQKCLLVDCWGLSRLSKGIGGIPNFRKTIRLGSAPPLRPILYIGI